MVNRSGIFEGNNPFEISKRWISEAEVGELNDPNAIALSTVSEDGMPNVRMVLLKNIDHDAFVFFTNFTSKKLLKSLAVERLALSGIRNFYAGKLG